MKKDVNSDTSAPTDDHADKMIIHFSGDIKNLKNLRMNLKLPVNLIKSEDQLEKEGNQTTMGENTLISHKLKNLSLSKRLCRHIEMETSDEDRNAVDNDVWELVTLHPRRKTVGSKWVYKMKTGAD